MKSTILRILIGIILLSLLCGVVVSIVGLLLGWNTSAQFGDGFFWAAVIIGTIGFVSLVGYRQRGMELLPLHLDPADRAKLWAADAYRGQILMAVFGTSGLLLFGFSILVSRLH
jgi:hypothetical protein